MRKPAEGARARRGRETAPGSSMLEKQSHPAEPVPVRRRFCYKAASGVQKPSRIYAIRKGKGASCRTSSSVHQGGSSENLKDLNAGATKHLVGVSVLSFSHEIGWCPSTLGGSVSRQHCKSLAEALQSERKQGFSAEPVPVSAYVFIPKNLQGMFATADAAILPRLALNP
jgi:hypothetical protein